MPRRNLDDAQLQASLRAALVTEARPGRILVFVLPLLLFTLSPVYGPVIFETPDELLLPIRLVSFGLIIPASLLGLYGAMVNEATPGWADVMITVASVGVLAGLVGVRSIGLLNDFAFPFSLICFYVVAMLIVTRVPFRIGLMLSAWCAAVLVGLEWALGGFTPVAHFNVLTAILVIGVAVYTSRVLEQTALHAIDNERRLQALAETDGLSGLLNRRAALDRAAELFRRASRQHLRLALAIVDIDKFKAINDSHGHARGDDVIRRVGQQIAAAAAGSDDIAARLGGEEFLLLWNNVSDTEIAAERARRLLEAVAADASDGLKVTVTIGLQQGIPAETAALKRYLSGADSALYEGKRSGRNRLVLAAPLGAATTTDPA